MYSIITIKTDKTLKELAQATAKKLGVPLSTVINAFLKQFVRDQEVTFSTREYITTPYLEALVKQMHKERGQKRQKSFTNARAMIKDLRS
jgi:addiction module RelB/DinJ family antitoxin